MKNLLTLIFFFSFLIADNVTPMSFLRSKSNSNPLNIYNENDSLVNMINTDTNIMITTIKGKKYKGKLLAVSYDKKYLIIQTLGFKYVPGYKIPFKLVQKINIGEGEKREYLKNLGLGSIIGIPAGYGAGFIIGAIIANESERYNLSPISIGHLVGRLCTPIGMLVGGLSGLTTTAISPPVAQTYKGSFPHILIKENGLIIK